MKLLKGVNTNQILGYGIASTVEPMINNLTNSFLPSAPFVNEIAELFLVNTLIKGKSKGMMGAVKTGVNVIVASRLFGNLLGTVGFGSATAGAGSIQTYA